jgi:hypothetical protein
MLQRLSKKAEIEVYPHQPSQGGIIYYHLQL